MITKEEKIRFLIRELYQASNSLRLAAADRLSEDETSEEGRDLLQAANRAQQAAQIALDN